MDIEDTEDFMGLEGQRISYQRFYTADAVRRPSQAPTKMVDWANLQLPQSSILHTLNGFDTLEPTNDGMPDPTIPLLANEKNVIYLRLMTQLSDEHSKPFGVDESYSYRPAKLTAAIAHFFQSHRKFHRVLSDRTLGTMGGVLTWVDYSPLNEARVNGTLHNYRKFDILLRTILNTVSRIGSGQHHFIVVPQGSEVYSRTTLIRSFKELSTSTLNTFNHDPSIFFALHVLGFVYGKTHELDVKPYKEDIKLLGKDSPLLQGLKSTSLFERLNPSLYESINFIFQKGNKAVIYNLADIVKFSEEPSFFIKMYRHLMNLRITESMRPDHIDPDSDQFDNLVDSIAKPDDVNIDTPKTNQEIIEKKDEAPVVIPTPVVVDTVVSRPAPEEKVSDTVKDETSYEGRLRKAAETHVQVVAQGDEKKKNKKDLLIENHFNANLSGKPIGQLIVKPNSDSLVLKDMDFLTAAPEESYKKSSLLALDRTYQDHSYHHDFAKVISSTAKHGLFITKIDEDRVHTEMDRTVTYKVSLSDLDGKAHHVKFTVPDVDRDGMMKLSGVEYRLTRQAANIPICKISPTRVNLSSYYNKIIVSRVESKRFSYESDMYKLITELKSKGLLKSTLGSAPRPTVKVPYDYSAIGNKFTEISFGPYTFHFSGDHASYEGMDTETLNEVNTLSKNYGVYVGTGNNSLLFWDSTNQIHEVIGETIIGSWGSFNKMLVDQLGSVAIPDKTTVEWTQAHILNQKIPIIFILAYQFGLKSVLDMIKLNYKFYPLDSKPALGVDDIAIRFSDGVLVFNRYPISRSLVASGLGWVTLRDISFSDMNIPQTYSKVFSLKQMSVGVLKGLRGFIDFFVDPITESVLEKLGEPITFHELLLRANVMLSDYHAEESSSVSMHRYRLYERFNGIIYNQIYRALANHRNNPSSKKAFSINPEAVFQSIVQDATVSTNDTINPVHEVKQRANITFTGSGGRSGDSFVLRDRIYPKDGLGVISDAVPDSGKVGITAYLTASPNINDVHGLPTPYKEGDKLEPPQILSIGAMVMPEGTTDDGKRNSYLSIQMSHYVPNHEHGETLSVRTGYDQVLPHLSSNLFATAAEDNGTVEAIDDKTKVVKIRYTEKDISTIRALRTPYLDSYIDKLRTDQDTLGYLIPDTQISDYPIGGVLSLSKNTNGRITDRLRCDTVDVIPDKDVARKQNSLIQDLIRGKYKSLYFIRFVLIGKKTPGVIKSYSFKDVYSPISGSHLLQKREANVKTGDKVKYGDILVYNSGFFVPDPLSKQVTFKHGVTANIALIEKGSNHEDACEITQELSDKLQMTPCHQREIVTKKDAAVLSIVKIGDHVETTDPLCIISDEYLVQSYGSLSTDNLDLMEKLNRQTPTSGYTGYIRKIRILYSCERDELSESLKSILVAYEKEVRQDFKALNNDPLSKPPERPGWVPPSTKYAGVLFDNNTVILEFMIEEKIGLFNGDKAVIGGQLKTVVSHVSDKSHFSESGIPIEMLFSSTGVTNRIVQSAFSVGITERVLDELKKQVVSMYFD